MGERTILSNRNEYGDIFHRKLKVKKKKTNIEKQAGTRASKQRNEGNGVELP
jgi:hypothetical protein